MLPDLWKQGEVRATHESDAQEARKPHTWRTRPDPFEGVWCEILDWLQFSWTAPPGSCGIG